MKMSRTVAYGLQAMLMLAEENRDTPVPCSELAETGQMPERFLLQILRSLVTHGVLVSTRGVEGGYRLARDANEITLLNIFEAIEGPMESSIPVTEGFHEQWQERVLAGLDQVTRATRKQLKAIKLSALMTKKKKGKTS
ncbi:MAG: Rrf2 family transcriptional regulator [Planctomycetales bacterium]|nr:Rrf2 family transcriptional regulator [Planctomycetales bacterium]